MKEPYKLFTDGSFFPYLKRSGIGGYLLNPLEKEVFCFSEIIEDEEINIVTNQPFEILAVEKGLQLAIQYGIENIICHSDDESLCDVCNTTDESQIAIYIEKNPHMARIFNLKVNFNSICFQHIPRQKNTKADLLSREAFKTISRKREFKKSKYAFSVPGIYYSHAESYREKHFIQYKRKQCKDFLIFKIEPKHLENILHVYQVKKESAEQIEHQLLATYKLGKNWMPEVVDFVADYISKDASSFLAFYVLGHHQQVFEDIFTGFNDITQKTATSFSHLKQSIESKQCVLYYQEENILFHLFGKSLRPLEGKDLLVFLKNGVKLLSNSHYKLGSNLDIENYFEMPLSRQGNVLELRNKYFGEYIKVYLREHQYNLKSAQEMKAMVETLQLQINEDLDKEKISC